MDAISRLILKDTAFQELMQRRIFNVLLVASPYDAFIMEDDGRVEEQLFFEYVDLKLSSPPRIDRASDLHEAMQMMAQKQYHLIITMPGNDVSETVTEANIIKDRYPDIPLVILTPFSKAVSRHLAGEDLSKIDFVFSWLGNVDLLLAIIKLLEDWLNADHDINDVGIQTVMLVEDSVRFYSSVLPTIYKFLLQQSRNFSTEALNEHERMLRMRGRPKVVLARNYEEAVALYRKFSKNMLGVITDVSFSHNGEKDSKAGIKLADWLREQDSSLPIIVESSEIENREEAEMRSLTFLDKNSKKLPLDLGAAMMKQFGFGDFVIRDPETGKEVTRLRSLKDMQNHIFDIPAESFLFHARSNDISRWLYSRALFPIADALRRLRATSLEEVPALRQVIFDLIVKYRKMKNRGVVAIFRKDRFDYYSNFARIGEGSLGGKGRGLAFIDSIIKKNQAMEELNGITITTPRTVVLCTDIFDEFMRDNGLYPLALSNAPDEVILRAFLAARLPERVREDFRALFEVVDKPLAVRSSSLLEDSHYQPFAGIYATYMIPHVKDPDKMLFLLTNAIKGVYASVFYRDSKAYMTATSNVIDQEKMAVIIQEVIGTQVGDYYYPSFSGVGRSLNYYPIGDEKPEEGIAEVAVGLGKYIVDGGRGLRFSPLHPHHVLQTSELSLALRDTQTTLYALDHTRTEDITHIDEGFNIAKLSVQDVAATGALRYMVSTYDFRTGDRLADTDVGPGRKVVTFNNVLKHGVFPLAEGINCMLTTGQDAMKRPIEIEFAGMIDIDRKAGTKGHIYWLQIRPIIDRKELVDDSLMKNQDPLRLLLRSNTALGNGNIENLHTVVYVRTEHFDSLNNPAIAAEIAELNRRLTAEGTGYVLIGPGRWGSSDPALGVPVKWSDIAGSRLIVEVALPGYRIEPSQGTHFFHNLTSMGVGYLTIDTVGEVATDAPDRLPGVCNFDLLNARPAAYESDFLRMVTFDDPLEIGLNGRTGTGVVLLPPTINKP